MVCTLQQGGVVVALEPQQVVEEQSEMLQSPNAVLRDRGFLAGVSSGLESLPMQSFAQNRLLPDNLRTTGESWNQMIFHDQVACKVLASIPVNFGMNTEPTRRNRRSL